MGSTHSSVKDKNNILSHTFWSCGDKGDFPLYGSIGKSFSNEWSINGEKSIKLIQNTPASWGYLSIQFSDYSTELGEQYTIHLDVYNPNESFTVKLYESTLTNGESVSVPSSENVQHISITKTMTEEEGFCGLQVLNNSDGSIMYIDNISLIKS